MLKKHSKFGLHAVNGMQNLKGFFQHFVNLTEWHHQSKSSFCSFEKSKSLIQKSEQFDIFRLVIFMSVQNFKYLPSSAWEKQQI